MTLLMTPANYCTLGGIKKGADSAHTCLLLLRMFFFLYWRSSIFAGIDCMDDSLKSIGGFGGCTSSIFARAAAGLFFSSFAACWISVRTFSCSSSVWLVSLDRSLLSLLVWGSATAFGNGRGQNATVIRARMGFGRGLHNFAVA